MNHPETHPHPLPFEPGTWAGFGVAGNFAGHLEQAGEVRDFASLVRSGNGPKGMFPFHLRVDSPIGTDPVSSDMLRLPEGAQIQGEPESAILCRLEYPPEGGIIVHPFAFGAFDDASIRREGARKISEKKNWGPGSKGASTRWIPLPDGLVPGCPMDACRIVSFLRRDGIWAAYGVDSPILGYSLYGTALVDWISEQLWNQIDEGPLENLRKLLDLAERPKQAVITIGATRYTELGETGWIVPGDAFAVCVYDPAHVNAADLPDLCAKGIQVEGMSLLVREARRA